MNALVSVIVPTYRRDRSLELAVESLIRQTYENVEIIVVDDNADPMWNAKVQRIVSHYPQVKCICNERNCGSARSRNTGIYEASGEYITFLDDDDIYMPEKIAHQLSEMERCGADFSLTDLKLYNDKDVLVDTRIRDYLQDASPAHLRRLHLMHHMTGTDVMMFRRTYLLKIGCFPLIDIGDEFYLMDRAIAGGGSFRYIPGCYVKAYVHTGEGGLSSGQKKIDGENALYEYKKQFFHEIDRKAKRFVKMRHFAVIAFAEIRRGNRFLFVKNAALSFLSAPVQCLTLFYTTFIRK